jgi:peroxiredoxin
MVAIAREQSKEEITGFGEKHGFSFPLAPDPQRRAYKLFADAGIPRTYVVGRDGKILFQSVGFVPEEIDRMIHIIEQELKKAP